MNKTITSELSLLVVMMMMMMMILPGTLGAQCPIKNQFEIKGKCQYIQCRNNNQCANYKSFCVNPDNMKCLLWNRADGNRVCVCREQWQGDRYGSSGCNYNLYGDSKCGKGKVCDSSGLCVPGVACNRIGRSCDNDKNRCCGGLTCQRDVYGKSSCSSLAEPGETCSPMISCNGTSQCINGKCSKRKGDYCKSGDVCPPKTECKETQVGYQVYKNCACIRLRSDYSCA